MSVAISLTTEQMTVLAQAIADAYRYRVDHEPSGTKAQAFRELAAWISADLEGNGYLAGGG